MFCRGRVENGVIVIEGGVQLPEGVEVRIETVAAPPSPTLYDRFRDVIGKAVDLPDDLAEQHNHYLYGAPKS